MGNCSYDEVEKPTPKQCDFIVSNSITMKPQYRLLAQKDFFNKLGKYSIDDRVGYIEITAKVVPSNTVDATLDYIEAEIKTEIAKAERGEEIVIKEEWNKLYDLESLLDSIRDKQLDSIRDKQEEEEVDSDKLVQLESKLIEFAKIVMDGFSDLDTR